MSDKNVETTEAIVIRTIAWSEADLILHVISRKHGRLSVLARAARKSRKRFSSCPDIFDRGSISYKKGRGNLPYLTDFTSRASFLHLREDLLKLAAASLVCECFDLLVKEESEGHDAIFELLSSGMDSINASNENKTTMRTCYLVIETLLNISGFGNEVAHLEPSLHTLNQMLRRIESLADRELHSKSSLISLVTDLMGA